MENSTVANVDQKDASLYVSFAELDDELVNMASIQKKNLQEFKDLRDAIKNSPAFNLASPVQNGYFRKTKDDFITQKNEILKIAEQQKCDEILLKNRETELRAKIKEIEKNIKNLKMEEDECVIKLSSVEEMYKKEKMAVNFALDMYKKSFGMHIITEEEDEDLFKATLGFNERKQFRAILTINRKNNKILDVICSLLSKEEQESMMSSYNQTENALALLSTLKKLALSKSG